MTSPNLLDPDRLFPVESRTRGIARALYEGVRGLPIISPHGHTDPRWYAENERFPDPAQLFVVPDHYVFRMLCSQGVALEDLGVPRIDGGPTETDGRKIWRRFAENFHLFRGTPSAMWINHSFAEVFGLDTPLNRDTADHHFHHIDTCLGEAGVPAPGALRAVRDRGDRDDRKPPRRPAVAQDAGGIGLDGARGDGLPADAVIDPDFEGFAENVAAFGELTGCDTSTFDGYLEAHRKRRAYFREFGATSTDHGHPTARTEDLPRDQVEAIFARALAGEATAEEADAFRGHMLTEMARMSLEDGMVMQIHPGSVRNHSGRSWRRMGATWASIFRAEPTMSARSSRFWTPWAWRRI